ncbi:unnamed protein product [Blumeria hordei]|uniref:C2H2-type domain-containing protein n=1 Tax=Blumeria hordei TaxID=2867405 RepID=A0A383UV79_BLUHO|nr:unnamed protein product [Blumeria hordei]
MDIPSRGKRALAPPPSIQIVQESPDRYRPPNYRSEYNNSSPLHHSRSPRLVPGTKDGISMVMPPPKRFSAPESCVDLGREFAHFNENSRQGDATPSPSSSISACYEQIRPKSTRHTSCSSNFTVMQTRANIGMRVDEGYESMKSQCTNIGTDRSGDNCRIDSPNAISPRFHVHDKFQTMSRAYDKEMLSKLDFTQSNDSRTPPIVRTKPIFCTSSHDLSPTSRVALEHISHSKSSPGPNQPTRSQQLESSLSRWPDNFSHPSQRSRLSNPYEYTLRSDTMDSDTSPIPFLRHSGSGVFSVEDMLGSNFRNGDSTDQRLTPERDDDIPEETGIRRLKIDDHSTRPESHSPVNPLGKKRRASSPPEEDGLTLHSVGSASDLFRRRESATSRGSICPRIHTHSDSISSNASDPRNNSIAPALSLVASSMGSLGRRSPNGTPWGHFEGMESPRATSMSSNPSPRGSLSRLSFQQTSPDGRSRMTPPIRSSIESTALQQPGTTTNNMQGIFMCECCPKKPKKFDTQEELNNHEQEKQYECAYCRNRFKNKNEAERHQNSLHLRRHSWSCAALSGYSAAFHNSPTRPSEADTCGYCGEDFPRSGILMGAPVITEQDWDMRITHLTEMHKFGECNHTKKFFRADHFRQHLKHSHAGTSGKWTNILENACMKDEPLPEPIRGPERVSLVTTRATRINEEVYKEVGSTNTLCGKIPTKLLNVT